MNAYMWAQMPLIAGFVLLLVVASLRPWRPEGLSLPIAVAAQLLSALIVWTGLEPGQAFFGHAIEVTETGRSLAILCLVLSAMALLLSRGYLDKIRVHAVDWRMVVVASSLGMVNLSVAGDLATFFIAYELVSIPSYVLAGFATRDPRSNEAGMKYLLLGIFGSALLLLGISFLYGAAGEIHLDAIGRKLSAAAVSDSGDAAASMAFARLGLALLLSGIFFKVAVAPFHMWLPDVYHGSNLASLAVIGAPVKVAVFGALALLLWGPLSPLGPSWQAALLAGIVLSVLAGNFQALTQTSLKRIIAYSAVVNGGFILLGILVQAPGALLLYLAAYGVMTLGAWAAFMAMGTAHADVEDLGDLAGMGRAHPWLALGLTVLLLSYAGIPLTVGFAAKFGVLYEAARALPALPAGTPWILVLMAASGLLSFYYYFQIVKSMWLMKAEETPGAPAPTLRRQVLWNYAAVLLLCAVLALSLGFFPNLWGW